MNPHYRHGDLILDLVPAIPAKAKPRKGNVLAEGEATGHTHTVEPLKLKSKYLVVEQRPEGGVDRIFVTGAELLARQGLEYVQDSRRPNLVEVGNELYFRCPGTSVLQHQEHGSIALPPGDYRRLIQVEYVPGELPRQVMD